ncbi:hypothetical protein [Paracraurococcus ruber]|uniref:Uncharacterized protein n=1 Tax=Paracraurococcus ruber TaxID=77675 RepID=A0ABS1CZR6_9PROT|nr:hypothetical protein [Paracraurococcus ruber]MBK1659893.1 hypothetical protein [Paracraurococcus ruber]TDG31434.1 hypothetical protein E2C05_10980 [Paracraurococcus ruber]
MTSRQLLVPPRRHRHGFRPGAGSQVYALLAGLRPGRGVPGGAPPAPPEAPPSPRPRDVRSAQDDWARFQAGMAAGG